MAGKEVFSEILDPIADGYKGEDEMGAVGGDEVGEGGGEDAGPVAHNAATPMDKLQLLRPNSVAYELELHT